MFIKLFQHKPTLSTHLFHNCSKEQPTSQFTKALILSASLGASIPTAQAADFSCTWKGKILQAGEWTNLTWGPCNSTFPDNTGSATYDATLRTGFSGVSLNKNIEIQNFNFTGGTFKGENELTVNETFNWPGGNLMGTGIIDVLGQLELSRGRKVMSNAQTLINSNTANWSGGSIDLFGTSELVNAPKATFNVTNDRFRMFGSSTAQFINEGNGGVGEENGHIVVNLSNPSKNVQFDGPNFNNNGLVTVQQGTARLGGGGISTGAFEVADGQTLNFSGGNHTLLPSSSVTGATVEFSHKDGGGITTIEGLYNVDNTIISGNSVHFDSAISQTKTLTHTLGFLDGLGDIVVTEKTTLAGGWIQSPEPEDPNARPPQAILATFGELNINGNFIQIVGNRRIMNFGIANWTSGGIRLHNTHSRFENTEGAIFNIKENATFIVGAGRNLGDSSTTPLEQGLFVNRGDVVVELNEDRQPVQIHTRFANLGKLHLQGDKLSFGSDLLQFASGSLLFDIGGSNANELDTLSITGKAILDGVIDITLTNSFVPQHGATFDILVAKEFETTQGLSLGGQDGDKFDFNVVPIIVHSDEPGDSSDPLDPSEPQDSDDEVFHLLRLTYR